MFVGKVGLGYAGWAPLFAVLFMLALAPGCGGPGGDAGRTAGNETGGGATRPNILLIVIDDLG